MKKAPTRKELKSAWAEYHTITPHHRVGRIHPKDIAGPWVVLEKVHGANFCLLSDGKEVVAAKRSAVLHPDERFYDWQLVHKKYENTIKTIYERVRQLPRCQDVTEVCVFGELYGGFYPHPDVPRKQVSVVQKGVYYSPDIDFCAFDIQVIKVGGRREWLNYQRAIELFDAVNIFHAPILMQGTLDECMLFNIRINSTIPAKLGLPPLPQQNQMEGVVIKAIEPVYFLQRDPQNRPIRAIFKKKNDNFDEVNPRFSEGEWTLGATRCSKKRVQERRGAIEQEMARYINVNRLHNLESKMGPVGKENEKEAAVALAEDALKDFIADHPEDWERLDRRGKEINSKRLRARVAEWLAQQLNDQDATSTDPHVEDIHVMVTL